MITIDKQKIEVINMLIKENSDWHRTRLSKELCKIWNWRRHNGDLQDMSCRSQLLKLDRQGYIQLPPRLRSANNNCRHKQNIKINYSTEPIDCNLKELQPLLIRPIKTKEEDQSFRSYLSNHHYIGYNGTVGENIKYLVIDNKERIISVLLFGAAAWRTAPRDNFIGWNSEQCKQNLFYIANNTRFLIFPWVKVKNLASHILGKINQRISDDWQEKYNHPLYMLETFVELNRFIGTCYKASNWQCVGETKGRTRNDRYSKIVAPIKSIYLYPLTRNFRQLLQ